MILSKGQERKVRIMDSEMISVCVVFGSIGGTILVNFIVSKIVNFVCKKKDKKRHEGHPEFFRLRDEFAEKVEIKGNYYNNEISPRKCKVDSMLREEHYWSQEAREKKMEEIEKLRREIYTAECMYNSMSKETQEARQKVVEYVRTHNIKWAGVWE